MKQAILLAAIAVSSAVVQARDIEVSLKNKQFSMKHLALKVGDTVRFKNQDPFVHNVFSLSDAKTFDLGSYPQGQSRIITLDKPGTIEVECAIHPGMKMVIDVQK